MNIIWATCSNIWKKKKREMHYQAIREVSPRKYRSQEKISCECGAWNISINPLDPRRSLERSAVHWELKWAFFPSINKQLSQNMWHLWLFKPSMIQHLEKKHQKEKTNTPWPGQSSLPTLPTLWWTASGKKSYLCWGCDEISSNPYCCNKQR